MIRKRVRLGEFCVPLYEDTSISPTQIRLQFETTHRGYCKGGIRVIDRR